MQVSEVRARFYRKVQVRDYEPADGEIEFKAILEDGENHLEKAAQLMAEAKAVVKAGLTGKAVVVEEFGTVEGVENFTEEEKLAAVQRGAAGAKTETAAEKKKRLAAEKRAAKKAEKEAAEKAAAEKATGESKGESEIPDDAGGEGRAISETPEDRKNPEDEIPDEAGEAAPAETAADPEIPDEAGDDDLDLEAMAAAEAEAEAGEDELSHGDLQKMIMAGIKDKLFKSGDVLPLLRERGCSKTSELDSAGIAAVAKFVRETRAAKGK